jgi:predicted Ser/Thr protein kinase
MNEHNVTPNPAEASKCPQCGRVLPAGAPAGLCPACLLAQGGATETATGAAAPPFQPPSLAEIAPLFPQLEILELIGKGGMGAVYKARQKELDRIVALKILPPGIGNEPAFAERFTREAKALAKLNHPGIVTIYDFGRTDGLFYFFMEFVDGVNLRQLLQAGRVSAREALAIVPQICDALQFAHDQGIVHRDIKPENILLDRRGRVKVADFGLAKLVGVGNEPAAADVTAAGLPALTESGKVMGTPNYMAPEQVEHPTDVDHRADIYALGVVFYQMLTGELPGRPIQPPSKKVQIDVRLDEVVLRALEKRPELRYQQASVLKTQVETIATTPASGQGGKAAAGKSEIGNQKSDIEPHFSRTAIVAACWAPTLLPALIIPSLIAIPSRSASAGETLGLVVAGMLMLVGITAPAGTTTLGWIAVAQIRRSAGRLYGLGLAVFDGLLFPLLALDTLVFAVYFVFIRILRGMQYPQSESAGVLLAIGLGVLALVKVAALDYIIIRKVWRAVTRPVGSAPTAPPVDPPRPTQSNTGLANLAIAALWVSAVLAAVTWLMMPHPPAWAVSGILAAALGGVSLALPARTTRRGKVALWFGSIQAILWVVIWFVFAFMNPARAGKRPEAGTAPAGSQGATAASEEPALESVDPSQPDGVQVAHPNANALRAQISQAEAEVSRLQRLAGANLVSAEEFEAAQDKLDILRASLEGNEVKIAEIRVAAAERALRRVSLLFENKLVSTSDFEKAKAELDIREAELRDLQASFGPVIERVLNDRNARTNCCIDLDTGRSLTPPATVAVGENWQERQAWLRETGADFMAEIINGNPCLTGFHMARISVDAEAWDNYSARKVRELVSRLASDAEFQIEVDARKGECIVRIPSRPTMVLPILVKSFAPGQPPWTLAFRTREGNMGLLQILGTNAAPRGVRIRYKLLQQAKQSRDAAAAAYTEELGKAGKR